MSNPPTNHFEAPVMRFKSTTYSAMALILLTVRVQAATVELELMTEPGFPVTGGQTWARMLQDVGASSVRIRAARSSDRGGIEKRGTDRSPIYQVKGFLSADNTLRLPGGTFRSTDRVRIKAWVEKLKADGVENITAKTGAFGLTSKQLLGLHKDLATPIVFSTKGEGILDVVQRIANGIAVPVRIDDSAREALYGKEVVAEELTGMSAGTALAAVLRPLGLVASPYRESGSNPRIEIVDARRADENWPVGWPSEESPRTTMPKLFEFLNVEIDGFALSDALGAIQKRLDVPFLYDHNSLARHGLELKQIKVSVPSGRTYYKGLIDRMLLQTKPRMKAELRVDEAEKPFLWITTVKP